jgi:flagellar basal body-associated protein FliL
MTTGPTKEELQNYWTYNRQYFESLAKYYAETDKEYYNKFIAPFYSPFRSSTSNKSGAGKLIIIMFSLALVIAGAAAAFFVLMQSDSGNTDEDNKVIGRKIVTDTSSTLIPRPDTIVNVIPEISPNYDKGLKYFKKKDYTNAEKYFNLVPKSDKNYVQAQKKIVEIKIIRGEDVEPKLLKPEEKDPVDNLGHHVQPKQRIR